MDSVVCFYFDSQFIFFRVTLVAIFSPPPPPALLPFYSLCGDHLALLSPVEQRPSGSFLAMLSASLSSVSLSPCLSPQNLCSSLSNTCDLLVAWFTIISVSRLLSAILGELLDAPFSVATKLKFEACFSISGHAFSSPGIHCGRGGAKLWR